MGLPECQNDLYQLKPDVLDFAPKPTSPQKTYIKRQKQDTPTGFVTSVTTDRSFLEIPQQFGNQ